MTIATTGFDYAALDPELRGFVQARADEIHRLDKETLHDYTTIGQRVAEVHARLPRGQSLPWLDAEFAWSERTALRLMRLAHRCGPSKIDDCPACGWEESPF